MSSLRLFVYPISLFLFFTSCSYTKNNTVSEQEHEQTIQIPKDKAFQFYSWTEDRIPMISAHRGGPYPGYPENAIETFKYILESTPAVIECDIEMTKDSVLVMMHDNTLDRTTNGSGKVRDHFWNEVKEFKLKDNDGNLTAYEIPTLKEVLDWTVGRALLTLDVKRGVPFEKVIDLIKQQQAGDYAAVITYSANDAQAVYELDSTLMISVGIGNMKAYKAHHDLGIPDRNMIAFTGVTEPEPSLYKFLHDKGIYAILGVLGNLDKKAAAKGDELYASLVKRGADILATDRPIEAARAIKALVPDESSKSKYFR